MQLGRHGAELSLAGTKKKKKRHFILMGIFLPRWQNANEITEKKNVLCTAGGCRRESKECQ
jgi:hypothetical protein